MSRLRQALHNELQALELLRDELKLQSHLFKAELKQSWEELEVHWDELKGKLVNATSSIEPEIEAAAKKLMATINSGYERLKSAIKS